MKWRCTVATLEPVEQPFEMCQTRGIHALREKNLVVILCRVINKNSLLFLGIGNSSRKGVTRNQTPDPKRLSLGNGNLSREEQQGQLSLGGPTFRAKLLG